MKIQGPRFSLVALCAISVIISSFGCHRGYYRRQADAEAQALTLEKMNDPRWDQIRSTINISPESRMYDVFSADHPPMPPDDPASHKLMERVDGKPGYPQWHADGDTCYVENPEWRSYLPVNEDGEVVLDIDTAVQLALINSPEYQQQYESLYLSALDVALERFGFDTQAFSGFNAFFDATRFQTSAGFSPLGSNRTTLEKLGITGTELIVGMANSIIWNFNGPDTQSASSLFDFSLIQPLLRGAGRDVIMESLTQSERNLLGDVRQMARFRRGFYLFVTTGRSAGAGPGSNFLGRPGGGIVTAGGFLGLLQTQQEIRIQEFNVRSLQNAADQFREFFNEQRVNLIQVTQTENSLLSAQTSLLTAKVGYENDLDRFKIDLGLPPDLKIVIKDPFLEQFKLIDDEFIQKQLDVIELRDQIGAAMAKVETSTATEQADNANQDEEMEWSDDLKQLLEGLKPTLETIRPLYEQILEQDVETVRRDFRRLDSIRQERINKFEKLRAMIEASDIDYEIESSVLEPDQIAATKGPEGLEQGLEDVLNRLQQLQADYQALIAAVDDLLQRGPTMDKKELARKVKEDVVFEAPDLLTEFYNALVELTLLQARARTDSIALPDVDMSDDTAIAIAYQFRRDLMNARAALVDQWRQIEFVADDLEGTLDLEFDGSVGSNDVNSLYRIRWETAQYGMRMRFDAPITRLAERNRYRQALINYQQARRSFYGFEDEIKRNLRQTIRNLERNKVLFELERRRIKTSVQEVENAQFDLVKPVEPGRLQVGQSFDSNASRNLTDALDNLQGAQLQFLGVYVNFDVLRRGLDFDLGTMQITPEGIWLDPGTIDASVAVRAAEAFGISPETLCLPEDASQTDSTTDGESAPSEIQIVPEEPRPPAPAKEGENDAGFQPLIRPAVESESGVSESSALPETEAVWPSIVKKIIHEPRGYGQNNPKIAGGRTKQESSSRAQANAFGASSQPIHRPPDQ